LASGDQKFAEEILRVREEPIEGRDIRFRLADKSVLTWVVNASAVTDDQKQLVGVVLTGRDERELRKARSKLQITDRLATMGSLAAGVAHEINNPLSFVMSNLEFALEELETVSDGSALTQGVHSEIQQALKTAYDGTERVAAIVRDLKSVSRVESDSISAVNINKLLDSASAMLQHEIRHRAVLEKDYGPDLMVLANEARVMQVFLNLIQNAAQALPVGSASANSITLRSRATDTGQVCIEVADTGCGIAEEDLQNIFDDFFTTKAVGVGTGLGLSISHRLVTQMDGTIEVESSIDEGTVFRVYLQAAQASPASKRKSETRAAVTPASRQRVLVIDDEAQIGQAVRRLLKKDYEVDLSLCGEDALDLYEEHRHQIIICDLRMPEMSGPDFRLAVLARFPESSAAFIFMTGGEVDADHDNLAGAHQILEKPFSPSSLRDAVGKLVAD
jgi:signal transduction histidine kinase